jgi:hypothetical protein
MPKVRLAPVVLAAALALSWGSSAHAVDLTDLDNHPIKLDVTETSIVAQHFGARGTQSSMGGAPSWIGEDPNFQGYFAWLNRLNIQLSWWRITAGLRLDSALYGNRPADQPVCGTQTWYLPCLPAFYGTPDQRLNLQTHEANQYRNSIYPAKLWVSYTSPGLEVTVGDAYVQFGRGLILAMRKVDELGLDTTLRGGKIAWQSDPFALTFVAGFANPSRVDEASGRALFLAQPPPPPLPPTTPPTPAAPGTTLGQPVFGSDRVIGADIQAGRGLPVTFSTHAVRFTRCSPVHYDSQGDPYNGAFDAPFGSCDPNDTQIWLSRLTSGYGPMLNASEVNMVGQSIEIPSLWGHGKLYLEAAAQNRYHDSYIPDATTLNQQGNADGNAIYGALSVDAGPVTNTLEVKSFRNFYPMVAAVDVSNAIEFGNVAYSFPPTTEAITQDSELGFFGACVNGGRLRSNVRLDKSFLLYGAGAYYHSQTETLSGTCDSAGHTIPSPGSTAASADTYVWDALAGIEWFFDDHLSHLFASTGGRNDVNGESITWYREFHAEYALTKHLTGPYSLEITGRHRFRYEVLQNSEGPNGMPCLGVGSCSSQPWHEGDNYLALKVSPKYVFSQGFEYTSLAGLPATYFNGSVRYNFRSDSSVVLFVGQQRGGLRCVSGVCRVFPAFEGARMEVTVRF